MADTVSYFGIKMTRQAFLILITGIIAGVLVAFKKHPEIGVSIVLGAAVQAYTVNCTVVGHCNLWAWILTVGLVISSIMGLHLVRNK